MDKTMKCGVIAIAVSAILASAITWTTAQESDETPTARYGTGLICDTAEQVEQFVALTKTEGDLSAAIEAVNSAVGNPQACGVATIRFVAEEEVQHAGTFKIVRVLVVGFNDGEKWFPVQPPHFQFTIFDPSGQEV
jgi:hypothetical protein